LNFCGYLLHFSVTRRFVVVSTIYLSLFGTIPMKLTHILLGGGIVSCMATAAPVPLLNFSGEVNSGVDRALVSDPSVIGWNGSGAAEVIDGGTDYGNGRWRLSLEDSAEAWQMTSHVIAVGDAFSLRFDAAMFSMPRIAPCSSNPAPTSRTGRACHPRVFKRLRAKTTPPPAPTASPSGSMIHCREARRTPSIAPAGICLDTLMPLPLNLPLLNSFSA
jgi:hypothetical protein